MALRRTGFSGPLATAPDEEEEADIVVEITNYARRGKISIRDERWSQQREMPGASGYTGRGDIVCGVLDLDKTSVSNTSPRT